MMHLLPFFKHHDEQGSGCLQCEKPQRQRSQHLNELYVQEVLEGQNLGFFLCGF